MGTKRKFEWPGNMTQAFEIKKKKQSRTSGKEEKLGIGGKTKG